MKLWFPNNFVGGDIQCSSKENMSSLSMDHLDWGRGGGSANVVFSRKIQFCLFFPFKATRI